MSRYRPALLGGLFIGIFSSLPVLGVANACCCLWVVLGGMLTTYLLQQERATPVEASEAALGGVIAGALGSVIWLVITAVLLSVGTVGVGIEERLREVFDQNPQVPPEMRDMLVNALAGPRFLLVIGAVTLPTFAVFGMIGALLGLAIFRKKPPVAPPPDIQA